MLDMYTGCFCEAPSIIRVYNGQVTMSTLTRMQNKEGVAEVLPSARFKSLAATSLRSLDLKN